MKNRNLIGFILALVCILSGCTPSPEYSVSKMDSKGFTIDSNAYIQDGMLGINNGLEGDAKRFGYIDLNGQLKVPPIYKATVSFEEGLAFVIPEEGKGYYIDKENKKVIEQVLQTPINFGDLFKGGYALLFMDDLNAKGEKILGSFVINHKGEVLLTPTPKDYYYDNYGNGLFGRYLRNGARFSGIVDTEGNEKYTGTAIPIWLQNEGSCYYTYDQETYGLLDCESFEILTEPDYVFISKFEDNVALVTDKNGQVKIIDQKGTVIQELTNQYEHLDAQNELNFFSDGVVAINFTEGTGAILLDVKGNIVKKSQYDRIQTFNDGIAICEKDGLYGYVDSAGKELVPPQYETATNINQETGFLCKDESWYLFKKK